LLVIAAVALAWLFAGNLHLREELAGARGMGEVERLILPADSSVVRIHLDLGIDDYESYRATLRDENGDEVWSQSKLQAATLDGKVAVAATLPTDILAPGDYSIRLSGFNGSGDLELVGRYRFRALRQ